MIFFIFYAIVADYQRTRLGVQGTRAQSNIKSCVVFNFNLWNDVKAGRVSKLFLQRYVNLSSYFLFFRKLRSYWEHFSFL